MPSSGLVVGNGEKARMWVKDSALPNTTKAALSSFIDRFPTLTFYREESMWLDSIEGRLQITLPRWFRAIRQTLTFAMPDHYIWARFHQSQHPHLSDEELRRRWYTVNLIGAPSRSERALLERMQGIRPYPIGRDETPGGSTFAINLSDATDQRVFEYGSEFLMEEDLEGNPIEEAVNPMFGSYADMIGHIDALKMIAKVDADGIDDKHWPSMVVIEAQG